MFLVGEWWEANLMMGAAFSVAGAGVIALGWWVLRGDRKNRHHHVPGADPEPTRNPPLGEEQAH